MSQRQIVKGDSIWALQTSHIQPPLLQLMLLLQNRTLALAKVYSVCQIMGGEW